MNAPIHSNPIVKLDISHSKLNIRIPEVRFSMMVPICEIKDSLVKRIGTSADSMDLQLKDQSNFFLTFKDGQTICSMNDDLKPLGYYSPMDGYTIHVIDNDPHSMLN